MLFLRLRAFRSAVLLRVDLVWKKQEEVVEHYPVALEDSEWHDTAAILLGREEMQGKPGSLHFQCIVIL